MSILVAYSVEDSEALTRVRPSFTEFKFRPSCKAMLIEHITYSKGFMNRGILMVNLECTCIEQGN